MTQRDWQKDMEMAHTARYEYDISHLNNVLDSLFYWLGAYGGLESAYEKQIVEAGKYSERADAAEARVKELESIIKAANDENDWLISGDADELYGEAISTLYPDTPAPKEGTDWLNEESCARCGRNKPVEGYEWCSECRPDLKAKEESHETSEIERCDRDIGRFKGQL